MKPPVETVRVSQRGKEILIRLKRKTGIEHWNVLCRWALMHSLANPTRPPKPPPDEESNVEMKWQTFGGAHSDLCTLLLRACALRDFGATGNTDLGEYLKAHLERGLTAIQNRRDLADFIALPTDPRFKS